MTEKKIIKVCGMTDSGNIREIESLGIELMGFIFYPKSPRRVKQVPDYLPSSVKRVGVFVDAIQEDILLEDSRYNFDYIQLHGKESAQYCTDMKSYGFKLIKAFSISNEDDLKDINRYEGLCEYFLFDTKTPKVGGSGEAFDWSILDSYTGNTPFLLSGGLSLDNIDNIRTFSHPMLAGYDLNSRFETSPGRKDKEKVKTFISSIYE